jgi:hypothetical protein
VRILTTLREIKRAFEGSKGEDIDVFTCAQRVDGGRAVSEGLRDACANGIQAPLNFQRAHSLKQSRVRVVRRTC